MQESQNILDYRGAPEPVPQGPPARWARLLIWASLLTVYFVKIWHLIQTLAWGSRLDSDDSMVFIQLLVIAFVGLSVLLAWIGQKLQKA